MGCCQRISRGGYEGYGRLVFIVFLQLGGEVHSFANDRVFEPVLIADSGKDHRAGGYGAIDMERIGEPEPFLLVQPKASFNQNEVKRAQGIGGGRFRYIDSSKRRHHSVA